MSDVNVQTILSRAADLLEERGWGQGVGSGLYNQCCLVRSVDSVAADQRAADRALEACFPRIGLELDPGDLLGPLIRWNDAPTRTLPEVLAVLRAGEVGR